MSPPRPGRPAKASRSPRPRRTGRATTAWEVSHIHSIVTWLFARGRVVLLALADSCGRGSRARRRIAWPVRDSRGLAESLDYRAPDPTWDPKTATNSAYKG